MQRPIDIPVVSAPVQDDGRTGCSSGSNCDDKATVALMVLGDSMEPEFAEGEILVIEMGRPATDGDFVIAEVAQDDFIFRQLQRDVQGGWQLHALNPAYPATGLSSLETIKGVVTHKRHPRSRKSVKYYVPQPAH